MTDYMSLHRIGTAARSLKAVFKRLREEKSGMGGVEFAIIAPLLLMLYITAFEVTVGLSVAKRATRTAGVVADLVSQSNQVVTKASLATMSDLANAIFSPYSTTQMELEITRVDIDSAGKAKVGWAWAKSGKPSLTKNQSLTLPADMATPGTALVHAKVTIPHKILMFIPGLLPSELRSYTISREYYYGERIEGAVLCSDCS